MGPWELAIPAALKAAVAEVPALRRCPPPDMLDHLGITAQNGEENDDEDDDDDGAGRGSHWSIGPSVHWSIGPLVHWSIGPLVHWGSIGGPLAHHIF